MAASRKFVPQPSKKNPGFPSYKGGHTVLVGGYIFECYPSHPNANNWGFVAQHRLVAEDKVGRILKRHEVVHHIDEVKTNNHPSNIQVMTQSEHRKHHCRINAERMKASISEDDVRKALLGRTIKEAAQFLGCHHQTLRNRYPAVIAERKRKPPTDIDDPKMVALIRKLATDDQWSYRRIAKTYKICHKTVVAICKKHRIRWVRKSKVGEIHTTYRRKTASPS